MRARVLINTLTVIALIIAGSPMTNAQQTLTGTWQGYEVEYTDGQISIRLREGYDSERIREIISQYDGELVINFDKLGWGLAQLPEGSDIFSVIDELLREESVEAA